MKKQEALKTLRIDKLDNNIMKNTILYFFLYLFAIGFILLGAILFHNNKSLNEYKPINDEKLLNIILNAKQPKIGECYIYHFESKDPFKNYPTDTIKILQVKGEYLKYKYNNGFITSDKIEFIMEYSIKTDSCNCL